jgi:hypothetical protein
LDFSFSLGGPKIEKSKAAILAALQNGKNGGDTFLLADRPPAREDTPACSLRPRIDCFFFNLGASPP